MKNIFRLKGAKMMLVSSLFFSGTMIGFGGNDSANANKGIFAILRSKNTDKYLPNLVKLDALDGITFYIGLSKLEPQKGQYDWSLIDKTIKACRKYNKKINLAIIGGRWIPSWIYEDGCKKFSWELIQRNVGAGKSFATAPIPWDPIYLKAMKDAATALGKRYANFPEVISVQVTGPSLTNGLEANLNITPKQAKLIAYTKVKYINAWKEMFEAYDHAFPDKQLSWSIHDMFPGKRDPAPGRAIRDWAFKKYGKRFNLMCCYLTDKSWFVRGNQAVDIWAERPEIHRGAQLIDLYSAKKKPPKCVSKALKNGAALGSKFYEIFAGDCLSPKYYNEIVKFKKDLYKKNH